MIIGFDAKRAVSNNTGLGNYSRLVIDVLSRSYPGMELRLYAPHPVATPRLQPLLERPNVTLVGPDTATGRRLSALWRIKGVTAQARRDGIELFHGLSNELPLNIGRGGFPSVVTIHDLIFRKFPKYYKPIDRKIYDYKFRKAAENATRVIAISECTRRDLIDLYGISPHKIDVVYQGCDPQFHRTVSEAEKAEVTARLKLDFPYIIGVGTIEERKNQLLTLRALRSLPKDVRLVLVGRRTPYTALIEEEAARLGLTERLHVLSGVPFADFPALYAGALASSYPSRYEGFGIPVIESMSVGTPCVIASGSCLEEAGGPHTPVVSPDDADALGAALCRLIDDTDYRRSVIDAGIIHANREDDDRLAQNIFNVYQKCLKEYS